MSSTFKIDGVTIDWTGNDVHANGIALDSLTLSLDDYDVLHFSECPGRATPSYSRAKMVDLTIDGSSHPNFRGRITGWERQQKDPEGVVFGYVVKGLKWCMDRIAVTNPNDYTGRMVFNRKTTDPLYNSSEAGKEVGQMLKDVLDAHADQMLTYGIAGYVQADLDLMTLVPQEPVTFFGPQLAGTIDMALHRWQGHFKMRVAWHAATSSWRVRFVDTTDFTPTTLVFGDDPIDGESFRVRTDNSEAWGRTVVRGESDIKAAILSTLQGTLAPHWDSGDQSDWTWNAFASPRNLMSAGSITVLHGSDATVDPDDNSQTWAANKWPASQGWITLINPVATGINFSELRRITSNSALAAGSTSIVSWYGDLPLYTTGYTRYQIAGSPYDEDGEPIDTTFFTWLLYDIIPPYVRDHLGTIFPTPQPFGTATAMNMVEYPSALIFFNAGSTAYYVGDSDDLSCGPIPFELDRRNGRVKFSQPVVVLTTTQSDLDAGGDSVNPPYDVRVIVPYSVGVLQVACPRDAYPSGYQEGTHFPNYTGSGYGDFPQYSGTSYTIDGIAETYYEDVDDYHDHRMDSAWQEVACMIHDTHKDVLVEGSVVYKGDYLPALELNLALNFEDTVESLGELESINAPIRSVTIDWPTGNSPDRVYTLTFSNRRQMASGVDAFVHPTFQTDRWGQVGQLGGYGGYGGGYYDQGATFLGPESLMGAVANLSTMGAATGIPEVTPVDGQMSDMGGGGFDMDWMMNAPLERGPNMGGRGGVGGRRSSAGVGGELTGHPVEAAGFNSRPEPSLISSGRADAGPPIEASGKYGDRLSDRKSGQMEGPAPTADQLAGPPKAQPSERQQAAIQQGRNAALSSEAASWDRRDAVNAQVKKFGDQADQQAQGRQQAAKAAIREQTLIQNERGSKGADIRQKQKPIAWQQDTPIDAMGSWFGG